MTDPAVKNHYLRSSPYSVKETLDRLERIIAENDSISVLARIDQAALIAREGGQVPDIEMLLFENRALAKRFYELEPSSLFWLPIRALAWQDGEGKTWLQTTDPDRLDAETGLNGADGVIAFIDDILGSMVDRTVA